jgi:hypothetical protein
MTVHAKDIIRIQEKMEIKKFCFSLLKIENYGKLRQTGVNFFFLFQCYKEHFM